MYLLFVKFRSSVLLMSYNKIVYKVPYKLNTYLSRGVYFSFAGLRSRTTFYLALRSDSGQCRDYNVSHNQQFNYSHLDNHTVRNTDNPGLKPFIEI